MRGLVSIIFLIHLVITQGVTQTKLGNLIKCRLKLKAQKTLKCKRVSYRPQIRLQIDQMSVKIESSRNITNMSAIDPKVRLQMATSVYVTDFKLMKYQLNLKLKKYYKRVSCTYPKVRLQNSNGN